jgi:hypothetical protein
VFPNADSGRQFDNQTRNLISKQGNKMARGGYRPGAGRPVKAGDSKSIKREARKAGMNPLEYMLDVMNDQGADPARRDRMAIAAAPFVHARAEATTSKKDSIQEAAAAVAAGQAGDWGDDLSSSSVN